MAAEPTVSRGQELIPLAEAISISLHAAAPLGIEEVSLGEALFRVLAEDAVSDLSMPPYDKSMVDGYACRRADLGRPLRVVETVVAGRMPERGIGAGECAKIMTGAPVPQGADCVFMVEHSETSGGCVTFVREETADNIAPRGKDIQKGARVLGRGHWLRAADVAVLAAVGVDRPKVFEQPTVGVVATGDELVEPDRKPGPAQIRNSNAHQIVAQLATIGIHAEYCGIARDNEGSLREVLGGSLKRNRLTLVSGGVSMGDLDLVPGILEREGYAIQFAKVAMQPGKPTVFARSVSGYCFGLPGNPVSSYCVFELIVKPFLLRLMGHDYGPPSVFAALGERFTRKAGAREAYVPVRFDEAGRVRRIVYHGSAHINALSGADGLTRFCEGVTAMEVGEIVPVRLIRL